MVSTINTPFTGLGGGTSSGPLPYIQLPQKPVYMYSVAPRSASEAFVLPLGNIANAAVSQTYVPFWGNGYANPTESLLYTLAFTTIEGQLTGINYQGYKNVAPLDCQRTVTVSAYSGTFTNAFTYYVNGWDNNGVFLTASGAVSSGAASFTTIKCFSILQSVYFSANPGVTFTLSGGPEIGLPYFINTVNSVFSLNFGGEALTPADFVTPGALWRQTDAVAPNEIPISDSGDSEWTIPQIANQTGSTSPTGIDARGYVDLEGETLNGTNILNVLFYVYGADTSLNEGLKIANAIFVHDYENGTAIPFVVPDYNLVVNNTQQAIENVQAQLGISGLYAYPSLTIMDLYGAQVPGNRELLLAYNAALLQATGAS